MQYEPKEFDISELTGISQKQLEVHLGLYKGYVTHVNKLREQIATLKEAGEEKFAYAIAETRRRLGFEFNGMRMHEYYFEQLAKTAEGGSHDRSETGLVSDSPLAAALAEKYGSWEGFLAHFKEVATSRGIGWVVLYADQRANPNPSDGQGTPHVAWVSEHELGTLAGLPVLLAMDMWEHAFMVDYTPAEKMQYVDAFLNNVNWDVVEERFVNI